MIAVLLAAVAALLWWEGGPRRRRGTVHPRWPVGPGSTVGRRGQQGRDMAAAARIIRELASLLRSGQNLDAALDLLQQIEGGQQPVMRVVGTLRVHRHSRWGSGEQPLDPVPAPFDALGRRLDWCFRISQASGAPLAEVLERLADDLEAVQDATRTFEVAMAGPRATTKLLTWLPVLGLGSGMLFGIDILGTFTASVLGRWALFAGVLLWLANRWWCQLLLRRTTAKAVG